MVSFEIGKEIDKNIFCHKHGTIKEKILSPHEELNLRTLDSALWCSTTEPQRLYGEWRLLRRSLLWSSFLDSLWGLKIFSLSYTPDNRKTSPYGSIRKLLWKKKKTVNVNTCVFDWLHFKKWCSEFNEFLLSQKSTGLFSSAKVPLTNLATDVYIR